MSWQGNECFVFGIDYKDTRFNGRMLEAMEQLLSLYDEHGKGWYLLGSFYDDGVDEDDVFFYESKETGRDPLWRNCWLPNPFMEPGVMAVKVRRSRDLLGMSFECADSNIDAIAYAGDGDEPLQHMVIYGEEYDLR